MKNGSDPHNSEYPAPRWKQVEWVSGFTGEAGDLVITADHADYGPTPVISSRQYSSWQVQELNSTRPESLSKCLSLNGLQM